MAGARSITVPDGETSDRSRTPTSGNATLTWTLTSAASKLSPTVIDELLMVSGTKLVGVSAEWNTNVSPIEKLATYWSSNVSPLTASPSWFIGLPEVSVIFGPSTN